MFSRWSLFFAAGWLCAAVTSAKTNRESERVIDKRQVPEGDSPSEGLPNNGIPEIPHLGSRIRDCEDLQRTTASPLPSGIYEIQPLGFQRPFQVFCDFETAGGKWTVIQRRLDGSVSFQRGWADYKDGFGNLDTEFWLGNGKISKLTSQKKYRLRIELTGRTGPPYYAEYSHFSVADELNLYKLALGAYSGNAGRILTLTSLVTALVNVSAKLEGEAMERNVKSAFKNAMRSGRILKIEVGPIPRYNPSDLNDLLLDYDYHRPLPQDKWEHLQAFEKALRMDLADSYHGGDALDHHRGKPFSTSDADNDMAPNENCAANHGGGWWFGSCDNANLNGRYGINANDGVEWSGHPAGEYLLRFTEMKIRSA